MLVAIALLTAQDAPEVETIRADYTAFAVAQIPEQRADLRFLLDPALTVEGVMRVEPSVGRVLGAPARIVVVRIDLAGTGAVAIVGYAKPHVPLDFFRDRWQNENGTWRLLARESIAGSPPLRFRDALVSDVLRTLDHGSNREWGLEAGANRRITLDLTGLDFDAALPRILQAADARPYRLPNGKVWFVPVHGGPYDQGSVILSSVDFRQADVRDACRDLFGRIDMPYSVAPDVAGKVTYRRLDVPMETTLQEALRQVHAGYRADGGQFQIFHLDAPTSTKPR